MSRTKGQLSENAKLKASVAVIVVLAAVSMTQAAIVGGVIVTPVSDGQTTESSPLPTAQTSVIDFDDVSAPCVFAETTALREQYSALGVHFAGPGQLDGGAILNMCGGFGVNARNGENFLAFNRSAVMSDGGIPLDPQTIEFDLLMEYVSIYAAGGVSQDTFTMDAYDALGNLIDTDQVVTIGWAELSVSSQEGIRSVVLTQTGHEYFVYDDLSFQPIPEPATLLILTVGGLGLLRKRKR